MSFFNPETETKTELPDYMNDASQSIVQQMMDRLLPQKFTPYTGDRVVEPSTNTRTAQRLIATDKAPTAIKTGSLQSYMNPFLQQVLNPASGGEGKTGGDPTRAPDNQGNDGEREIDGNTLSGAFQKHFADGKGFKNDMLGY